MRLRPEIEARIQSGLDRLPPMPAAVAEVMQMTRGDRYSANDLSDVVCKDPVIAARVLKLSNSGFYGARHEVTSIQKAVLLVGFEGVKNLVFSTFVHSAIQEDVSSYAQTPTDLWLHCLGVAATSMLLASEIAPDLTDTAYTAGLLHDIGKVVLASILTDHVGEVVKRMRSNRIPFHLAEREVLGVTHCEVGDFVAQKWGLPAVLSQAIRYHHTPEEAAAPERILALVHTADRVCDLLGVGLGLDGADVHDLSLAMLDAAGISLNSVDAFLVKATRGLLELQGADPLRFD